VRSLVRTLAALGALVVATHAAATPDAKAAREIDHLLAFVAASECRFLRSGTEYDGQAARAHLERKLDVARSMLTTAEQFVDHVATGSSLSGEAYKVRCGTRELTSRAWLRGELDSYRKTGK
jgi:hypothetical protein